MDKRRFLIVDGILYYEGDGQGESCLVVPSHLQQKSLDEQHDGWSLCLQEHLSDAVLLMEKYLHS